MLTVAIYGGAFNPPTITGHRHVVDRLLALEHGIDAVAVIPAFRHVSNQNSKQRLILVYRCVAGHSRV